MPAAPPEREPERVREDLFRIIRYTSMWILYGFILLVAVSSIAAAFQGLQQH